MTEQLLQAWGPGSQPEHSTTKISAKLCCVAQACCLSTWVAQVGGSGASHKKACLTLKHFSGYLFTIAALFPYPSQALPCSCPQTPISSCHFPAPNSPPSTSTARQPDSGPCLLASPGWAHPSLRNLGTYSPSSAPMYNPRLKSYLIPHKLPFHTAPATPTHLSGGAGSTQPSANLPQPSVADRVLVTDSSDPLSPKQKQDKLNKLENGSSL